jgi:hypothetical protein
VQNYTLRFMQHAAKLKKIGKMEGKFCGFKNKFYICTR